MSRNINVILIASAISLSVPLFVLKAHAQTVGAQPDIRTYSTATSSTVIITSPSGYKSQVISEYKDGKFRTIATSTPLTSKDIADMQASMQAQQRAIQELFQSQQALFERQDQLFRSFWSNFGL